MQRKKNYYLTK